ncbi:hypothetical protein [Borrelia persica]|uniref:hypothetical protein n=1 Tax=Borrelia persica TaxID=44448 RepID=UPI0004AFDABE|nr:hypothetical protein [Borrelia persica]
MVGFILGCGSSVVSKVERKFNDDNSELKSELVPFVRSSVDQAYFDLVSLFLFFNKLLNFEYSVFVSNSNPMFVIDEDSGDIVKELSCYARNPTCNGFNSSRNIYMAFKYDISCIEALRDIFAALNVRLSLKHVFLSEDERKENNRRIRIVSLLLFNLEQFAYQINLVKDTFSGDVLEKIKMSSKVTVENLAEITNLLLLFMQGRDELIVDLQNIIKRAANAKHHEKLMGSELKKIIHDGEIKNKIIDNYELAKTIQELVMQIVK